MSTGTATRVDLDQSTRNAHSLLEAGSTLLGGHLRPVPGDQPSFTHTLAPKGNLARFSDAGIAPGTFVSPFVQMPATPRMDSAVVLQKWEGRVEKVTDESFIASLADLTNDGPAEQASFPVSEVSRQDRGLVVPGAVFYWSVGYRDAVSGQRTHESVLRFRRLPRWSPADRREAAELADSWKKSLRWRD